MFMTAFSYTVNLVDGGINIVLTRAADGKQKKFFMAGKTDGRRLSEHMDTLTDGQCEQFYDDAKKKGEKKKDKKPAPAATEPVAAT